MNSIAQQWRASGGPASCGEEEVPISSPRLHPLSNVSARVPDSHPTTTIPALDSSQGLLFLRDLHVLARLRDLGTAPLSIGLHRRQVPGWKNNDDDAMLQLPKHSPAPLALHLTSATPDTLSSPFLRHSYSYPTRPQPPSSLILHRPRPFLRYISACLFLCPSLTSQYPPPFPPSHLFHAPCLRHFSPPTLSSVPSFSRPVLALYLRPPLTSSPRAPSFCSVPSSRSTPPPIFIATPSRSALPPIFRDGRRMHALDILSWMDLLRIPGHQTQVSLYSTPLCHVHRQTADT
ncbi:hypothetical protein B0H19DRAFT_1245475 [Mycena capillaripes]|nr:hypothetical protein B0H19DRAFT_1245475 [Mycena capillaripes]